jgi:general secretion pathway protein G
MNRVRGYTLIELAVVLAIIGVLASAVWPLAELSVERDRERKLNLALWEIRSAIDEYKKSVDQGLVKSETDSGFPPSLQSLVAGVPNLKTGETRYFLRRIPRDPFSDSSVEVLKSWGIRSYTSSAEHPEEGKDVYDVYTKSSSKALDGTLVRDW